MITQRKHGERRIRWTTAAVLFCAAGTILALIGSGVPFVQAAVSTGPRAIFQPVKPKRILDTRTAEQGPAISGGGLGRLLQVSGVAGVPSDATAIVANVTALQGTSRSSITVYPAGQSRPGTPNLFFDAAKTVANDVTVKLGTGGAIRIFNKTGTVHVVVSLQGYYVGHDHDDLYYTMAAADSRFFEGSTLALVTADGSPADNGAALLAAMDAITDASAGKPYTVRLAPGVYDVGDAGLDVKPFVELLGSGQDRSIVTAPGSPDLETFDGGTYGTVRLAGDSSLRSLTVRNTGGPSTIAVGIEVGDGTASIRDVNVAVSGGSDRTIGITPNHFAAAPSLDLERGSIEVVAGGSISGGVGSLFVTDSYDDITIRGSRVTVTGGGFGIAGDADAISGSRLVVADTQVSVAGGGTGLAGTANGEMLYDDVTVTVTGGTSTLGIGGSGSGFQPLLRNSSISVSGGSSSNKGFDGALFFTVTLQNSRISASGVAAIGLELGLGTTTSGNAVIDGSVVTATTIINSINSDTQVRVGASKLAGTTIVNGAADAVCVASYKSNYTALSPTCT